MRDLDTDADKRWLGGHPARVCGQRLLELVGRLPLHLVGVGPDDHFATPGLEGPKSREPGSLLPAHPIFAHFFGAALTIVASRVYWKIQAAAHPSDGIIGSRQRVFESSASGHEQNWIAGLGVGI